MITSITGNWKKGDRKDIAKALDAFKSLILKHQADARTFRQFDQNPQGCGTVRPDRRSLECELARLENPVRMSFNRT